MSLSLVWIIDSLKGYHGPQLARLGNGQKTEDAMETCGSKLGLT